MRSSMADPFREDKCEPALAFALSSPRDSGVRGARNTFTVDNTTGENIRDERSKLEMWENENEERCVSEIAVHGMKAAAPLFIF